MLILKLMCLLTQEALVMLIQRRLLMLIQEADVLAGFRKLMTC